MSKLCRFCHQPHLISLYPPTAISQDLAAQNFTCTNCGFGIHGPIVECLDCKIIYVNEKISQKQVSTYYEVAQDPLYFAQQPAREKTFGRYLKKLEENFPKKGKLLDIGTNTGLFVKLAQNSGWNSAGLEPNKWAVDFAKKNYGVKLINKPFDHNLFPANTFDVVTMWDVIEHFTDPVSEIEKVYKILKPGGVFALSTVDPKSTFARIMGTKWSWYMKMHLVFFTMPAARNYLVKLGFKKVIFKPHFRYLSLGYLATRAAAINPVFSQYLSLIINHLSLDNVIVPYYANDLYDCYAYK